MSRSAAVELWDAEVVQRALAYDEPDPVTAELAREVGTHAADAQELARWARAQPWPKFCAVVRLVSGERLREVLNQ